MRTYAEEKRSGTFELLLTSPLTDVQIVLGKFLGALTVFALMLLVSSLNKLLLFAWGAPEWKQLASSYLGLLLMGGSFIALGLFLSSLTRSQVVAGAATFAIALLLWIVSWFGESGSETVRAVTSFLSVIEHYEDFSKGVIDTKHLAYYLSFIVFGLFLTVRSVDSERWRG
jgi:ABC-2 type transport system permease protein